LLQSDEVLTLYIIDDEFEKIRLDSPKRWQFILQSLQDLDVQLHHLASRLHLIQGKFLTSLQLLLKEYQYNAIFYNEDYIPFSTRRENLLKAFAKKRNIKCYSSIDYPLVDPRIIKTKDNTPYKVFTPYYNRAKSIQVPLPQTFLDKSKLITLFSPLIHSIADITENRNLMDSKPVGGRKGASEQLSSVTNLTNYLEQRDFPAMTSTTQLSPYIRFGNLSIREIYQFLGSQLENPEGLVRQLHWRDFYTYIGFHFPHVYDSNFTQKYNFLKWENDGKLFTCWTKGETGFPIVDAGMRQLNQTGLMHNRVRMIVASFLVKDLLISWKWGERYFAKRLIDYDPAVNNGSWQWAASTGTDAQPYFRIFNPWRQQKKFDPNCEYIQKWIPELKNLEPKTIHNLVKHRPVDIVYPKPIVDHKERAVLAKMMFKR
jgi:deoxyribodipyrimidine photo-lyase